MVIHTEAKTFPEFALTASCVENPLCVRSEPYQLLRHLLNQPLNQHLHQVSQVDLKIGNWGEWHCKEVPSRNARDVARGCSKPETLVSVSR